MNLPEEMNLPVFSGKFIFWLNKNGEIQEMNLPEEMNLPVFSSKFISSGKFISWYFFWKFGLWRPLKVLLRVKHSLAVRISAKMKESTILDRKWINLRSWFLLRQKCILGRSLPPLGLYYSPRFARGCKADPRGVQTALGNTFTRAEKNFLGEISFPCRKESFYH